MNSQAGKVLALNRLAPGSTVDDRRDFAECFNTTLDVLGIGPGDEFYIAHPDFTEAEPGDVAKCALCGEPVDHARDLCRTRGWERTKAQGASGGSDILLRERDRTEWAHERCVKREKGGVSARQASFA